jgi:hypothetical protein
MTSNDYNRNNPQMNSNYNNSFYTNPLSNSLFNSTNFNQFNISKRSNFDESNMSNIINDSINEYYRQENETKEVLKELREKYFPTSFRRNNNFNDNNYYLKTTRYNNNQNKAYYNDNHNNNNNNMTYFNDNHNYNPNMTYFNNNHNNMDYSTFTEIPNMNRNSPNISTQKMDYYKNSNNIKIQTNPEKENTPMIQKSLVDMKDFDNLNINETVKLNLDNTKNSDLIFQKSNLNISNFDNDKQLNNSKTFLNDYLFQENEKIKRINKNYELLITPLIEYINDINYYFGQKEIDFPNVNNIIKHQDLNNNSINFLNELKSMLNISKNNIFNISKIDRNINLKMNKVLNKEKNEFSTRKKANIRSHSFNPLQKEEFDVDNYLKAVKPIIFDKKTDNKFDKSKSVNLESGKIKRAKTAKMRLPTTFWAQNKKVTFHD